MRIILFQIISVKELIERKPKRMECKEIIYLFVACRSKLMILL